MRSLTNENSNRYDLTYIDNFSANLKYNTSLSPTVKNATST